MKASKLSKVCEEIDRTERKIGELKSSLRELRLRRQALEDEEILRRVRALERQGATLQEILAAAESGFASVKVAPEDDEDELEGDDVENDWRHTFAVRAFRRMVEGGADMYVALPVLSTYLGHRTIYATERYVRLTMEVYPHVAAALAPKLDEVFGKGGWSE